MRRLQQTKRSGKSFSRFILHASKTLAEAYSIMRFYKCTFINVSSAFHIKQVLRIIKFLHDPRMQRNSVFRLRHLLQRNKICFRKVRRFFAVSAVLSCFKDVKPSISP